MTNGAAETYDQGREVSDRWERTLRTRDLAERIWNEAVKATSVGERHGAPGPAR